jgi:hypothetical protein
MVCELGRDKARVAVVVSEAKKVLQDGVVYPHEVTGNGIQPDSCQWILEFCANRTSLANPDQTQLAQLLRGAIIQIREHHIFFMHLQPALRCNTKSSHDSASQVLAANNTRLEEGQAHRFFGHNYLC